MKQTDVLINSWVRAMVSVKALNTAHEAFKDSGSWQCQDGGGKREASGGRALFTQ